MPPRARVVHQTRDRVRLRISERRKDLPYFLDLYEDLRQIPGVADVRINPVTGSVLLYFQMGSDGLVLRALRRSGLLPTDGDGQGRPSVIGRIEGLYASNRGGATQVRAVLLVIIIGLAIHQIRRGVLLAPALSVLWYAYDLIAARKKERAFLEAAAGIGSTPPVA